MLELSPARKNKINLSDYPFQQDIETRILMSDFSTLDIEILEEILYSPLKISLKKLIKNFPSKENQLLESLRKLASASLLTIQEDTILVEKERRKVFEFEITRFDPQFKPDMEFLQGLLRKVPIHVLPVWYSIPRTSNNIFESIVEKYLLTPHIFQRYMMELNLGDPILNSIMKEVFSAPDFKVSSTDLISKYNLKRRDFEEMMLILEFNFVCCLCYEKEEDHWVEFISPFYEWHEYLRFFKKTEPAFLLEQEEVIPKASSDFEFIEQMSQLLMKAQKKEIEVPHSQVVEKLCLVKLASYENGKLKALEPSFSWLESSLENRSLYLYRHPQNKILSLSVGERYLREAEKSIKRVLHGKWIVFEEFLKGVLVPLNEQSVISLKRFGKHWKYTLPIYGDEEKAILKAAIFEWLFELGMVYVGTYQGKDCFAVTAFGKFFFSE